MLIEPKPFSLFSSSPESIENYWLPVVREAHSDGILLCDLTPIVEQCDPLTAKLLGQIFEWADRKALQGDLAALRQATLPIWKAHLDLAIRFAKAAQKSHTPEKFLVTLAASPEGAGLDIAAVLEAIKTPVGDGDLSQRLSVSAPLVDQITVAADLLGRVKAKNILQLEFVSFPGDYPANSEFEFIIHLLLQKNIRSAEPNRLLAIYRKCRLRQMDEVFHAFGWVLEALRFEHFSFTLHPRFWSLLGRKPEN